MAQPPPLVAQRLASLRTRLLAFDCKETCGPDSPELVERLFGDLVSTTEVYQQLHEREETLSQELGTTPKHANADLER